MEEEAQPNLGARISVTSRGGCVLRPLPVQPPSPVTLSRVSRAGCREAGGRAELGALRTGPEATSLPICWRGLWWGGGAGQQAGLGPEQLGPVDSAQRLCGARGLRGGPPPAAGDLDGMVPPRGPQGLLPCPPRPRAGRRAGLLAGLYVNQCLISPSGICVEYHFFNYRPWAGLAAACGGANYHKSPGNN